MAFPVPTNTSVEWSPYSIWRIFLQHSWNIGEYSSNEKENVTSNPVLLEKKNMTNKRSSQSGWKAYQLHIPIRKSFFPPSLQSFWTTPGYLNKDRIMVLVFCFVCRLDFLPKCQIHTSVNCVVCLGPPNTLGCVPG